MQGLLVWCCVAGSEYLPHYQICLCWNKSEQHKSEQQQDDVFLLKESLHNMTMSIHLLFTVAYSLLIIRILLSPHTLSRWDSSEFWAVSKEKLNVKSISSKIGRQFWNNLSCFPVCSPDHSNPFLFRLKYRLRSCVKSLSDLANTGIRGLCLVDLNLT